MVWAGSPFAHRVQFNTGLPTGVVSWQLLGNSGATVTSGTITPAAGTVSILIVIPGANNTCATPLFENRTLTYNYLTADGLVSDRITYRVDRPVPFAVSPDGVRSKLGIENHELADSDIDLVAAYAEFADLFDSAVLTVHETAGDRSTILCIHAIEAMAALAVLATLQLKVAQRESSGTNEYQRFSNVEWDRIESNLAAHIDRAKAALDSNYDPLNGSTFSFGSVVRTDPVTGA